MHKCDNMSSILVLTHQQVELVQVGHDCKRQTLRPRMITLNPVTLLPHHTHMEYHLRRLAPSSHTLMYLGVRETRPRRRSQVGTG